MSKDGLFIVSLWERGFPTSVAYFTPSPTNHHATNDGNEAVTQAKAIGQPKETPIYFAVDYDATQSDLAAITAYFTTVHALVRAADYFVGVYGSGLVCRHLIEAGFVSFTWLAQSTGFAGFKDWKPHANIVQGQTQTVRGLDADLDESNGAAGGWQI